MASVRVNPYEKNTDKSIGLYVKLSYNENTGEAK